MAFKPDSSPPRFPLLWMARQMFVAPFQLNLATLDRLTLDQREAARRGALVELVILFLTLAQLVIGLPAAIINATPLPLLAVQSSGVVMGIICLILNRAGRSTLASSLYVFPAIIAVFLGASVSARLSPIPFDPRTLLAYCLQTVFILLIGLMLPLRMLWPTALAMIGLMAGVVILTPLPPGPENANLQALVIVFLGLIYLASAALSWVAARSARVGMEAVDRALEREREMTTLKDLFITDANHELRTPLMALFNDVKIAATLGEQASPATRQRLLGRALHAGETLLQLLNTVLDARMLDADSALKLDLQPVDIAALARDVLETFDPREIGEPALSDQGQQASRDVAIDIPPALRAHADPVRLRQIFVNLISNALKYSADGQPIRVAAALVAPRPTPSLLRLTGPLAAPPTHVRITVQDHGLGIPPQDAAKLFNRFVRLPRDITGSVRGTGLGLYICRRLVEAMGGEIGVDSRGVAGEGSTFWFTVPLNQ